MTDAAPGPAGAADPRDAEDPLAADKRTLTIGAISMVALILIGVVSAQLFARGGCATIADPVPIPVREGSAPEPEQVIDAALGAVDGGRAIELIEQVAGLPVTAAFPVGRADTVLTLDEGLVTAGDTVTSFDGSLTPTATYDTTDRVVGSGPTLYDVAVPNERTGQTDALLPLTGPELEVGTCIDTAVVGSPFAFLLDAGAGQLLLLRAEDDGDAPELQLRDAESGALWDARLRLPAGPPGTLAERFSARLGPDTVVGARRVGPQEETASPAVVAVSRQDGTERFALDGADLAAAGGLDRSGPIRWEVTAVGRTTALVHGRPDPSDAADGAAPTEGAVVLLDLETGGIISSFAVAGPVTDAASDPASDGDRFAVAVRTGGTGEVTVIAASGELVAVPTGIDGGQLTWAGGEVLVTTGDTLVRVDPVAGDAEEFFLDAGALAAVTTTLDGRVAVLVRDAVAARDADAGPDGASVLVVTTRDDELVAEPSPIAAG